MDAIVNVPSWFGHVMRVLEELNCVRRANSDKGKIDKISWLSLQDQGWRRVRIR